MTHKTLEDLMKWGKTFNGKPAIAPFLNHLRNSADPGESWKWLQDLLMDEKMSSEEISRLMMHEPPWKQVYGSSGSINLHLRNIRNNLLGVKYSQKFNPGRPLTSSTTYVPTHVVVKQAVPSPPDSRLISEKILMAVELGLSKKTLIEVLTEIL